MTNLFGQWEWIIFFFLNLGGLYITLYSHRGKAIIFCNQNALMFRMNASRWRKWILSANKNRFTIRMTGEKKNPSTSPHYTRSLVVISFIWMDKLAGYSWNDHIRGFIWTELYAAFQVTGTDQHINERLLEQSTFLGNLSIEIINCCTTCRRTFLSAELLWDFHAWIKKKTPRFLPSGKNVADSSFPAVKCRQNPGGDHHTVILCI